MKYNADPKIVAIGGGSGLSNMLRGLKQYTGEITAIVTMADDGGGSGRLRDEFGMPPPGDVRNCLSALANTEPTMEALLSYRFSEGILKGQSMGNLFLAALNDMSDSFYGAVRKLSEVLAITGRVLPVTAEDVRIIAEFDDGTEVLGESKIMAHKIECDRRISQIKLVPKNPPALQESVDAIIDADMILLGPGSLYTSIIPNVLTNGISDAIAQSDALKIYVLNVATEEGETENYTASEHVSAIFSHAKHKIFDYCIANDTKFPDEIAKKYIKEGSQQTVVDIEEMRRLGVETVLCPLLDCSDGYARHNSEKLANEIMNIFEQKSPTRIYR